MNIQELKRRAKNYRGEFHRNNLDPVKITILTKMGFLWTPHDSRWDRRHKELIQFKKENGHCNVPKTNELLNTWCRTQRQNFANGILTKERKQNLDAIGFSWDLGIEFQWNKKFEELVEFKNYHGHCSLTEASGALGRWCGTQRVYHKKRTLSTDHTDKLNSIGFEWNPIHSRWSNMYNKLVEFKNENGHCKIAQEDGMLGGWCGFQRMRWRKGKLSSDRISLLNKIGFEWTPSVGRRARPNEHS